MAAAKCWTLTYVARVPLARKRSSTRSKRDSFRQCRKVVVCCSGTSPTQIDWDRFYLNLTGFPFPLGPLLQRETRRYEIVPGQIWTFEQPQTFFTLTTNIRMTVVKLNNGKLWVHAPIAPTRECIKLIKELDAPIAYIILPTYAYEHKIFVAPFARRFPEADVYIAPSQWSWPISLPSQFFGIFPKGYLEDMDSSVPWFDEMEQKLFNPPDVGVGSIVECAFFHKASGTLLMTDAVVCVPREPLDVILTQNMLSIAAEYAPKTEKNKQGMVEDTPENALKGWMRNVLGLLYFRPKDPDSPETSFEAVTNKLIVSPVMRTLVYDPIPKSVTKWVDSIELDWNFNKIIPCHLAAPIRASPGDLSRAFAFSYESIGVQPKVKSKILPGELGGNVGENLPKEDFEFLSKFKGSLMKVGAVLSDPE